MAKFFYRQKLSDPNKPCGGIQPREMESADRKRFDRLIVLHIQQLVDALEDDFRGKHLLAEELSHKLHVPEHRTLVLNLSPSINFLAMHDINHRAFDRSTPIA